MDITFYFNSNKIQIFKIFSGTLTETVPMHAHPKNGYELHLIDSGRGILDTKGSQYDISKNTLFITGPNVPHKQISDQKAPMHELCVYFKITNTAKNSLVDLFAQKNFWIGKSNGEIKHLFHQMVSENEKSRAYKKDILSSLGLRLITEIAQLYAPENEAGNRQKEKTDLYESRSWILDQLLLDDCSKVTLNDFAENMGVSPRQAERIIKEYYGSSFKKLRYEAKMATAATLLEQQNISIEECSARCGYTSASAFTTAFKQKYNITPKAYREHALKSSK